MEGPSYYEGPNYDVILFLWALLGTLYIFFVLYAFMIALTKIIKQDFANKQEFFLCLICIIVAVDLLFKAFVAKFLGPD